MKILHFVLGCKNLHYKSIDIASKKTWASRTNDSIKTIFMYGDSEKIYYNDRDSFYVNYPESLNICLIKTITSFEAFLDNDFDYIFRSNTTGYFDLPLLYESMKDKPKTNFYYGCLGNFNNITFASGSGYFISKDLVENIVKNKELIYNYNLPGFYDDVSIGRYITQELKIPVFNGYRRMDILPTEVDDNLDMSQYHYRILNKGDSKTLYKIHELKCKNQL